MRGEKSGLKVVGGAVDSMGAADRLAWAKGEVEHLDGSCGTLMERAAELDDVRRCVWGGQDLSGKRLKERLGRPAFPFEGASDNRVRLADQVVNERVMLLVVAALRADVHVRGMESNDDGLGGRLSTLLRYALRSELGLEWLRTITLLAQYREGSSPAAALAGVYWERELGVRLAEVSWGVLARALVAGLAERGLDPEVVIEQVEGLRTLLESGGADEAAADLLEAAYPEVSRKRLVAAARELAAGLRDGEADPACHVPEQYVKREGPRVCAHGVLRDVFVPLGMREFQRSPYYVVAEWLAEYELKERRTSHGYAKTFVEAVLERGDGEAARGRLEGCGVLRPRVLGEDGTYGPLSEESLRGLYQVLTIVYRDVDDDGVAGVFELAFHPDVEVAAHGARVVDTPHGGYPGVWLQREVLSDLALDSRSWPELLATHQSQVKMLGDSVGNHAQLVTLPSLLTRGRRSTAALRLGPLAEVPLTAGGEVKPLALGEYPSAATNQQAELVRQANELAGRHADGIDPRVAQLHDEYAVATWMAQLREIYLQLLGLYQQHASAEQLGRITGADGRQVAQDRDAILGRYDLDVVFDARGMDMEYLREKAKVFNEVLKPLDMRGTVKWDVVVASMFSAFDPNLAERAVEPAQAASKREAADEETNFVKLAAGIEPEMAEAGQDFGLRLRVLQGIVQKNPATVERLDPVGRQLLQRRVQHLQHMVEQQKNAQTGRVGAEKVLG